MVPQVLQLVALTNDYFFTIPSNELNSTGVERLMGKNVFCGLAKLALAGRE